MNAEPSETSYISLQGNWVRYADFDLSGITELTASVATGTTGKLEFRVGSPTGAKIAEVSTAGTSSQWRTFKDYTSAVTGSYGIVDLYIVGTGDHGGIIDYVDFRGLGGGRVDLGPEFVRLTSNQVAAGQPAGSTVGFLRTNSPRENDSIAYVLSGADASKFTIDGNRLKVSSSGLGSQQSFDVSIQATDANGLSVTAPMTITVRNSIAKRFYYVSKTGSDSNVGSLSQPFRTIQKAADTAGPGDTVLVRAGTYGEVVKPANSGLLGSPITFQAYQNEKVILNGADTVQGAWSVHSGNIYKTTLNGLLLPRGRNQVLVNGENVNIARFPNSSDIMFPVQNSGTVAVISPNDQATLRDSSNLSGAAGRFVGATVNYLLNAGVRTTGEVTADPGSGTLTFDPDMMLPSYGAGSNLKYYLQDNLALLDQPGEWFINRATNELYLWMPDSSNPSTAKVETKRRTNAFDLTDKSHIVIKGFDLFATSISTNTRFDMADKSTWAFTSEGVVMDGLKSKYVSYFDRTEQNIPGQDIWIPSVFQHGLFLHGYNHKLVNSQLEWSWGSFVTVLGHDSVVSNNWMSIQNFLGFGAQSGISFGRAPESPDGAGVDSARAKWPYTGSGHEVSYNTIHDLGRDAIGYNGNRGGKIVHNHLYNCMLNTDDGGILYAWREDLEGLEIAYNYLHSNGQGRKFTAAVYMDGTIGLVVHHNLIHDAGWGIQTNMKWGGERKIFNNTIHGDPHALYYFHEDSAFDRFVETYIVNNLFLSPVHDQTHSKFSAQATQYSNNLFSSTSPLLVNRAAGDYGLQASSPAVDAGVVFENYNQGFTGSAPDIGAFERGVAKWAYGSSVAGESGPPASVIPTSASFEDWVADTAWASVPTALRDRDDDPDGDGFSNRLERALGMNPTLSDQPTGYSLKTERMTSGQMQVTLRYQKHAANETYELVHSTTLESGTWSTVGASPEQFDAATGGYFQTWTPQASQPRGFVRLRLTN